MNKAEKAKAYREELKAEGYCPRCYKRKAVAGKLHCKECEKYYYAYYQGIADKQRQKKTHMLYALARKRNNRTQDYLRKAARYIINYCIEHRIGTVVCGYNGDFKRSIDLGRITNQQFTQISFEGLCKGLLDSPLRIRIS